MYSRRTVALSFIVAFLFAAGAAEAGIESRIDRSALHELSRPLAPGARVVLERLAVGDTIQTLELERFDVWAPNAEIVIDHGDGRRERVAPPPIQYFRGRTADDPDSIVVIAMRSDGAVEGLVVANERRYRLRSRGAQGDVLVEEASLIDDASESPFSCELGDQIVTPEGGRPVLKSQAIEGGGVTADGTLSATGTWTLNLAIETDYELYTDLGSNAANVTTFIGNVVAQASVIYQRDLRTDLVIAFSRVQTSAADPFLVTPGSTGTWNGVPGTAFSTSHALAELGDVWANAGTRPYNGPRSSVFLLSGKNQTAGVAWVGRACQGDFLCGSCGSALFTGHTGGAYAYLGLGNQATTAVPDPNNTNNGIQYGLPASNYWALLGFAHELGHNVDGPHTHCVALTAEQKTQYGVTRNYIDECVSAGGCFGGAGSVPAEKGTIMSYCHLLGSSQSRFLFGRSLETSEIMVNRIRSYINSRTPASPAINAPASVDIGAATGASINSPVAGLTYDWTITNGTINGATQGTSINFTGTTNPVTLRVRGTNTSGCAASDSVSITVNTCTPPAITSLTSSATITLGFGIDITVTATGVAPLSYQWYVGSPGDTSTPSATGSTINVAPNSTTTYWARVTNGCGESADSDAVTISVVEPPATNAGLYLLTPCRIIDTRSADGPFGGPALASGATRDIEISGRCGIPAGAKSVSANITAVTPAGSGMLSLFPAGEGWPGTSTLSYRASKTRASSSILTLSGDGRVTIYNVGSTQHFIIDVTAYFQ